MKKIGEIVGINATPRLVLSAPSCLAMRSRRKRFQISENVSEAGEWETECRLLWSDGNSQEEFPVELFAIAPEYAAFCRGFWRRAQPSLRELWANAKAKYGAAIEDGDDFDANVRQFVDVMFEKAAPEVEHMRPPGFVEAIAREIISLIWMDDIVSPKKGHL